AERNLPSLTNGAIRKFYPGSGTTTLGVEFEVVTKEDGTLQCNSSHCTVVVTADEGIDDIIEDLVAHDGTLHYATLATEGAGVFSSTGPLPGVRILGGGTETLDVDQVMAPALDYDLGQASDL